MGSLEHKIFSNPAASDWLDDLEDAKSWAVPERVLNRTLQRFEEEEDKAADEQHPLPNALAQRCLVCAELIAASLGAPHDLAPDAFDDFLEQHGEPDDEVIAKALEALEALKWSFELERQLRADDVPPGRQSDRRRAKLGEKLQARMTLIEDLEDRLAGD